MTPNGDFSYFFDKNHAKIMFFLFFEKKVFLQFQRIQHRRRWRSPRISTLSWTKKIHWFFTIIFVLRTKKTGSTIVRAIRMLLTAFRLPELILTDSNNSHNINDIRYFNELVFSMSNYHQARRLINIIFIFFNIIVQHAHHITIQ